MCQPKVSVIIPVYNAEPYLRQCLESILNQTLKEIEVICVDDGSTDRSLEILQFYAEKDRRVKIISQENISAGAARNRGLHIAKGEYLSLLDADDFFEKDMLRTAYVKAVKANVDIIVFRSNQYDAKKHLYSESNWTIKENYLPNLEVFSHKDVKQDFFNAFVGWTWDKLFKTEFIQKNSISFQNQKSINDLLFVYSALARAERITIIQDVLVHKRINNANSISTNYSSSRNWNCFYDALLALREQLTNWRLYDELKRDYINYALKFTLWNLDKFIQTDAYILLHEKLKNEWLENLGILNETASYFYDQGNYNKLNEIMTLSMEEYRCVSMVRNADSGNFLFPFELIKQNAKIVLYGAGNVGKAFYRQVKYTNYCKIVAWCDKQYQMMGNGFSNPKEMGELLFDVVVIALNDENTAKKVILDLKGMGVESHRIIWRKPEIKL